MTALPSQQSSICHIVVTEQADDQRTIRKKDMEKEIRAAG